MTPSYAVGLDLGQRQDPSALVAVEKAGDGLRHRVAAIHRWPLGTPYPEVRRYVRNALASPALKDAPLIVDVTGVGQPVVDEFRQELDHPVVAIYITGGQSPNRLPDGTWSVPKKDLVGAVQSLLGNGLLAFIRGMPHSKLLSDELKNFKVKITKAANETFEAWREGDHDDLVLALAITLWWMSRFGGAIDIGLNSQASSRTTVADAPAGVFMGDRPIFDPRVYDG